MINESLISHTQISRNMFALLRVTMLVPEEIAGTFSHHSNNHISFLIWIQV